MAIAECIAVSKIGNTEIMIYKYHSIQNNINESSSTQNGPFNQKCYNIIFIIFISNIRIQIQITLKDTVPLNDLSPHPHHIITHKRVNHAELYRWQRLCISSLVKRGVYRYRSITGCHAKICITPLTCKCLENTHMIC